MRQSLLIFLILSFFSINLKAQEADTTDRYVKLNEVVISANKFRENKRNIIQKIDVLSSRSIARTNAQNTGDLLMNAGNLFVQKSQQGGSSPVIRGFEASRVLLVIDGVRMNNAIYRSGHLQNVITVDQNMLNRIEVMHGPSSTLYGSDALGGTIHLMTKQPLLTQKGDSVSGNSFIRMSSVNNEKTAHLDINFGRKKIAFLSSFNFSDFDDMRMGSRDHKNYPGFGRRNQYILPFSSFNKDTIVQNNQNNIQIYSGYKQWDILQKVLYKPSEKITHLLNLQLSNSSNIPRYDRLQDRRNGALRFAEWYYGPQFRSLAAYTFQADQLKGFFSQLRATLSYQHIIESRHTREYRLYDRFDSRREQVGVWGAIIDLHKAFGYNELSVGIDGQWNDVQSRATRKNLLTGVVSKLDTRYPDGKNEMDNVGLFAQHILKSKNRKWVLNDGIRLQYVHLFSQIVDNSFFNLPITRVSQNNMALTGNVGIAFIPAVGDKISIGFASGFRAPNIDDLSKVFETSTLARQVVIPNSAIKPEYTYNLDLSYKKTMAEKISVELTGFYTIFQNAIVKAPFRLNGQDSIEYNGWKAQVLASQNKNKASLHGLQILVNGDLNEHWSFSTSLNYTYGTFHVDPNELVSIYVKQSNGSYILTKTKTDKKPLDHIPPIYGKTSVQYRWKRGSIEFFSMYNGAKKLDQYNPDGEDNAQYATPDGMPGWITYNMRASIQVLPRLIIQSAIENITDQNYRFFASGFSAPGRNLLISIRYRF
ncbi:MAG: TonB-dependent receptor [Sphingobacteriales bacterium]